MPPSAELISAHYESPHNNSMGRRSYLFSAPVLVCVCIQQVDNVSYQQEQPLGAAWVPRCEVLAEGPAPHSHGEQVSWEAPVL